RATNARPPRAGVLSGGQSLRPALAPAPSPHRRRREAGPGRRAALGVVLALGRWGAHHRRGLLVGTAQPGRPGLGSLAGHVWPGLDRAVAHRPAGPRPGARGPARARTRQHRPRVVARVQPGVAPGRAAVGGPESPHRCWGYARPTEPRRLAGPGGGPG